MTKGLVRPVLLRLNLWRCLCSVVPNTPLVYLRWEGNEKGYAGLKGRRLCLLPQSAPPRTAFVCEVRDRRVGLLPVWEQRVYLMLEREGQAVIATQRDRELLCLAQFVSSLPSTWMVT